MKRLANHVSTEMHDEVNNQILDNTLRSRWLKQQSTNEFSLAKKIVNYLPIAPTNNLIYKIYKDILDGHYKELGDIDYLYSNFYKTLEFSKNMLIEQGIMFDNYFKNNKRYKSINDALTKNASLSKTSKNYDHTLWEDPYEGTFTCIISPYKDGYYYIQFNDFDDEILINEFDDYVESNNIKFIGYDFSI